MLSGECETCGRARFQRRWRDLCPPYCARLKRAANRVSVAVAFHEAGHAVVYHHYGRRLDYHEGLVVRAGRHDHGWCRAVGEELPPFQDVCVYLAGIAAEVRLAPRCRHRQFPDDYELDSHVNWARKCNYDDDDPNDLQRAINRLLTESPNSSTQVLMQRFRECEDHVTKLFCIEPVWSAVRRVAGELRQRRTLTGDDVLRLLSEPEFCGIPLARHERRRSSPQTAGGR